MSNAAHGGIGWTRTGGGERLATDRILVRVGTGTSTDHTNFERCGVPK